VPSQAWLQQITATITEYVNRFIMVFSMPRANEISSPAIRWHQS
jgi:hypothetical protein